VFLDLASFIGLAKHRLSDAGITAASLLPEVHTTVALAKADTLVRADGRRAPPSRGQGLSHPDQGLEPVRAR